MMADFATTTTPSRMHTPCATRSRLSKIPGTRTQGGGGEAERGTGGGGRVSVSGWVRLQRGLRWLRMCMQEGAGLAWRQWRQLMVPLSSACLSPYPHLHSTRPPTHPPTPPPRQDPDQRAPARLARTQLRPMRAFLSTMAFSTTVPSPMPISGTPARPTRPSQSRRYHAYVAHTQGRRGRQAAGWGLVAAGRQAVSGRSQPAAAGCLVRRATPTGCSTSRLSSPPARQPGRCVCSAAPRPPSLAPATPHASAHARPHMHGVYTHAQRTHPRPL